MNLKLKLLAAKQGRVILRGQALAAGMSDNEIQHLLQTGAWIAIRRGAYVERQVWAAMGPEDRHRALVHATLGRLTGRVVVSHISACVMLGLPVWGHDLSVVHVTRERRVSPRLEADVRHHSAQLAAEQIVEIEGLLVTAPSRTVIDTARISSFVASVVPTDAALRGQLMNAADLLDTLDVMRDWPGARNAGRVVEFSDGRSESVGESRARIAFDAAGLPRPELQFEVVGNGGRVLARADFYFEEFRTIVEFDGKIKYTGDLQVGEEPGEVLWREKQREDRLRELGYEIVRLTWAELSDPIAVGAKIRRAFARAQSRRAA